MAKRKEIKRKKELEIDDTINFRKLLIVILAVIIFLSVFYLITLKVTNKETDDSVEEETQIQTEEILVGSSFNRAGKEYIVVYYDKLDSNLSSITSKIYDYRNKSDRLPLYEADMSNIFNEKYVTSEEVNKEPKDASELMINGATLIKFSNDKVVEYIQGVDEILNYLA